MRAVLVVAAICAAASCSGEDETKGAGAGGEPAGEITGDPWACYIEIERSLAGGFAKDGSGSRITALDDALGPLTGELRSCAASMRSAASADGAVRAAADLLENMSRADFLDGFDEGTQDHLARAAEGPEPPAAMAGVLVVYLTQRALATSVSLPQDRRGSRIRYAARAVFEKVPAAEEFERDGAAALVEAVRMNLPESAKLIAAAGTAEQQLAIASRIVSLEANAAVYRAMRRHPESAWREVIAPMWESFERAYPDQAAAIARRAADAGTASAKRRSE